MEFCSQAQKVQVCHVIPIQSLEWKGYRLTFSCCYLLPGDQWLCKFLVQKTILHEKRVQSSQHIIGQPA